MDTLRLLTCGNVDDGKSTLIGRLLYDSKALLTDQIEAIERSSKNKGSDYLDLSLLTDGLKAEREQGITIDVAYIYFSSPKRKFIIADTPGHVEYTRNMVTGASNSDLAIVLIDARKGVQEQTHRHYFISSLLEIKHVIVAINKMDLVGFDQNIFTQIQNQLLESVKEVRPEGQQITFIPISALNGDMIVERGSNLHWYQGPTLLEKLHQAEVHSDQVDKPARFQVQWIIRPHKEGYHDYRGYAGRLLSGRLKVGDTIQVQPTGKTNKIRKIERHEQSHEQIFAGQSAVLLLEEEQDISRGQLFTCSDQAAPKNVQEFDADLCWMDDLHPLQAGDRFYLQHGSHRVKAIVKQIHSLTDVRSFEKKQGTQAQLNDICTVRIKTAEPISADVYSQNKYNGGFILINDRTNNTVAAGMLRPEPDPEPNQEWDF